MFLHVSIYIYRRKILQSLKPMTLSSKLRAHAMASQGDRSTKHCMALPHRWGHHDWQVLQVGGES